MRSFNLDRLDRPRRFRLEWLAAGVILSLVGMFVFGALYRERERNEAQEADRLQVQARVIDDNLIRQLEGVNHALAGVRDGLANGGPESATAEVSDKLKLLRSAMPGVRTLVLLDASGTIVASSRDELIGVNFRQREYFNVPRQRPNPDVLYVSAPFQSSLGKFVISATRAITRADGEFAGVIAATLDPEYFNVVLRSVLYAPDMRTTLVHADGKVFLNMPPNEQALGMNLATPGSLFSRHRQSGLPSTLASGRVLATDEERMVAMQTVDGTDLHMDKPLVAVVSRELSGVYTMWHTKAWRHAGFFTVVLLAMGSGLFFSQRRRQTFDRLALAVAKERQQGSDRLELALRGADLGLWDVHVPSKTLIANARERAILGYSPQEDVPLDISGRKMVHPDDRPAVKAALEPHLRGETEAYECEHRVQHKDGHWIWVFSRAMVAERDAQGVPVRIVGTHLDITAAKRAEAELARTAEMLRTSEEELRQVTDNLPVLVCSLDLDQRFRFVNRAYRDWFAVEPSSLLGRSLRELYGEEVYAGIRHHVDAALAGATVVFEREMATTHGRDYVEITLVPQRGSDGAVRGLHGLIHDLTARHDARLLLARSEERLNLALEGSGLALFDWDIANDRIYQSAQAAAMRDDPAVETTTTPDELQSFVHPDDLDTMLAHIKDTVTGATPLYYAEFRIRKRSGAWLWVRARGRVVERSVTGRALRLAGTYADINERKHSEQRLRRLAEFDTLTDLPNRAQFLERLQKAMSRAAATSMMALLFLDIDHFKTINDTLGHEAGDHLLKVFAQRMRASVRQSDMVARLAGDEFTVILEGLRDWADAKEVANKLVKSLREPIALAGKIFEITTSVGVAMCIPGETDHAALLRRADLALYGAKRRGRNGYFCDETHTRDGAPAVVIEPQSALIH